MRIVVGCPRDFFFPSTQAMAGSDSATSEAATAAVAEELKCGLGAVAEELTCGG